MVQLRGLLDIVELSFEPEQSDAKQRAVNENGGAQCGENVDEYLLQ